MPMTSRIDSSLTADERRVLMLYSNPSMSGMSRVVRLSIQFAIGAGIFVAMALWEQEPLYVLPVYGTFLAFLTVRLLSAKKIAGIMRGIIAKYEARIGEL